MKKLFLHIFLGCLLVACNTEKEAEKETAEVKKPNVILIYADDLGYGDLSSYGATAIETPNIDRLAESGIRFTNAHATASTCTPSRYSLLTGKYAFKNEKAHILPGNAALLIPENEPTLGTLFKDAGYKTAVVGKWHIGLGPEEGPDWNGEVKPGPNEVGFDYSFIFPATADRVPTIFVENKQVIALEENDPIEASYTEKVGNDPTGKENPELLKMKSSHGHDGTIVNGIGRIGWMSGGKKARWTDEELSDVFLAQASQFIEKNKDEPFFLYYPMIEPHVPRMPNTRFKGKSKLGYRGDVILQMDYMVGELMKRLESLGLAENTMIVFTSDNGPVLDDGYVDESAELAEKYDHKPAGVLRGGKYSMFEGGTQMPFIVNWPAGIKAGESNAYISQIDLMASLAELIGVDSENLENLDSENLLEALLGKSEEGRKSYIKQNNGAVLAYVKEGWKYIEPASGPAVNKQVNLETGLNEQPQLYNLKEDQGEQHNLADQYPDRVEEMKAELAKLREK